MKESDLLDGYNYYEFLGVKVNAAPKKIKAAYYLMVHICHENGTMPNEELFKKINIAYDTLKDPKLREAYDESLAIHLKSGLGNGSGIGNKYPTTRITHFDNEPYTLMGDIIVGAGVKFPSLVLSRCGDVIVEQGAVVDRVYALEGNVIVKPHAFVRLASAPSGKVSVDPSATVKMSIQGEEEQPDATLHDTQSCEPIALGAGTSFSK